MRKKWTQAMSMSFERGYKAKRFSSSNYARDVWFLEANKCTEYIQY